MSLYCQNLPQGSASNKFTTVDTGSTTSRLLALAIQESSHAPKNVLFRQIIKSCIKQARDYSIGPRGKSDRSLKP